MTFEILRKQPIKFYKQNGIIFFEPFNAVDNYKTPLNLSWKHKSDSSAIIAKSGYNNNLSIYDMEIHQNERMLKGLSIVANPKNKGIGEVLNLASLITFKENNFTNFSIFALRDAIQFYVKYGFNLRSYNMREIIHNLQLVSKSNYNRFLDSKISAKFFAGKITSGTVEEKKEYVVLANNLVSDYMRNLSRNKVKVDNEDFYNHSHMHFSSIDTIKNREYLNELFDKHEINYTI